MHPVLFPGTVGRVEVEMSRADQGLRLPQLPNQAQFGRKYRGTSFQPVVQRLSHIHSFLALTGS